MLDPRTTAQPAPGFPPVRPLHSPAGSRGRGQSIARRLVDLWGLAIPSPLPPASSTTRASRPGKCTPESKCGFVRATRACPLLPVFNLDSSDLPPSRRLVFRQCSLFIGQREIGSGGKVLHVVPQVTWRRQRHAGGVHLAPDRSERSTQSHRNHEQPSESSGFHPQPPCPSRRSINPYNRYRPHDRKTLSKLTGGNRSPPFGYWFARGHSSQGHGRERVSSIKLSILHMSSGKLSILILWIQ